jgi:hypothetical protein
MTNLQKKNLNPTRCVAGTISGWQLYFKKAMSPYVEPGWASIRTHPDGEAGAIHGTAFLIPREEADALDQQERGSSKLLHNKRATLRFCQNAVRDV